MYDLSSFEITPEDEVVIGGERYSKSEFVAILRQWLATADPGEYVLMTRGEMED